MLQFTICIMGIMDDGGNLSPSPGRGTNFSTMIVDRLSVNLGMVRDGKILYTGCTSI